MNVNKSATPPLAPELIEQFRKIVGDRHAITDAADIEAYVTEERNLFHGRSPLVLRPGSTAEVSAICKLASAHEDRAGAAGRQHRARRRPDARTTARWWCRCAGSTRSARSTPPPTP